MIVMMMMGARSSRIPAPHLPEYAPVSFQRFDGYELFADKLVYGTYETDPVGWEVVVFVPTFYSCVTCSSYRYS